MVVELKEAILTKIIGKTIGRALLAIVTVSFLLVFGRSVQGKALSETRQTLPQQNIPLPFTQENLAYQVSWSKFIKAGTATLVLSPGRYKDSEVLFGRAVAKSAGWMKVLGINVEDVIETFFDPSYEFSYFFEARIKETDYKKTKSITFDWNSEKIEYIEKGEVSYYKAHKRTHDVLSALFYVRTLPLKAGEAFYINVFDEGKEYLLKVEVMDRETLKLHEVSIPTLKAKIILKSKGIFNRKGDVYVWFSDDPRKIPVQMQCDIFLGFFHIALKDPSAFFRYR